MKGHKVMENCETCKFEKAGECRRYPPVLYKAHTGFDFQGNKEFTPVASLPEVSPGFWCGEWNGK